MLIKKILKRQYFQKNNKIKYEILVVIIPVNLIKKKNN